MPATTAGISFRLATQAGEMNQEAIAFASTLSRKRGTVLTVTYRDDDARKGDTLASASLAAP